MDIKDLTIGQVEQLQALFSGSAFISKDYGKAILVADRGFIYVGDVVKNEPDEFTISNADNIRYWGTTKGLGELVISGPTNKTKLDPCGKVIVPTKSVIAIYPTEGKLWKK